MFLRCFNCVWWIVLVLAMFTKLRARGATVARLTPDQKVACSNHVGLKKFYNVFFMQYGIELDIRLEINTNHTDSLFPYTFAIKNGS